MNTQSMQQFKKPTKDLMTDFLKFIFRVQSTMEDIILEQNTSHQITNKSPTHSLCYSSL